MYFDSWDEFSKAVEQLYLAEPNRVSWCCDCLGPVVLSRVETEH